MEEKDKKFILTPMNDAKKVSQVLANDTCHTILDAVSDEPLSASQISKKLNIPLTTVDYNLKKLKEVGLIGVHHKRWSPKGKKVNYYAPQAKFVVIAPKHMDASKILPALKSMLPAIVGCAIIGGLIEWFMRPVQFSGATLSSMSSAPAAESERVLADATGGGQALGEAAAETTAAAANTTPLLAEGSEGMASAVSEAAAPHYGLWFFLICLAIILIYVLYRTYRREK